MPRKPAHEQFDTRPLALAALLAALAGCAAPAWHYEAPPGVPASRLESDRRACVEESGIVRLAEERIAWEQKCMMDHGYRVRAAP